MAIFCSFGWEPWVSLETFPKESVLPDRIPLGLALEAAGIPHESWVDTQADTEHARRKQAIAEVLKAAFEAEGNRLLYENHAGEAEGCCVRCRPAHMMAACASVESMTHFVGRAK